LLFRVFSGIKGSVAGLYKPAVFRQLCSTFFEKQFFGPVRAGFCLYAAEKIAIFRLLQAGQD
jgi:hypothetical protein